MVVGIDIREGPLTLASSLKLKPDLLLNASEVTSEAGARMVEQLRSDGWDRGAGCDGESQQCVWLDLAENSHCQPEPE
jgi:hypothetical protein